jgi:hypothetical protein
VLWRNEVGVESTGSHHVGTQGSELVSAPDKSIGPVVILCSVSCTFGEVLFPECFHIIINFHVVCSGLRSSESV